MSSIHELLKQVYPLNLRMELFNAIWNGWRADIKEKDQKIADLEAKLAEEKEYTQQYRKECAKIQTDYYKTKQQLAESEKSKESYRLQNEHHHLQLLQFYSRLGVEAFGADIHEKALETLMIMKEQLAEKDLTIENWQTMYKSVVQTCHNDKEEIERFNKQLDEKDKEIEYQESMKILAVENQNKKAIEQLEKVKETTECVLDNALKNSSLNQSYYDRLLDEIDNQINGLKGEK